MKSIVELWVSFASAVMPKNASAVQRKEMRRAFYAGFHAALMAGVQMADESGDDDDKGVAMIQRLHDECAQFVVEVQAGRA
jgi:hypothetical protein